MGRVRGLGTQTAAFLLYFCFSSCNPPIIVPNSDSLFKLLGTDVRLICWHLQNPKAWVGGFPRETPSPKGKQALRFGQGTVHSAQ